METINLNKAPAIFNTKRDERTSGKYNLVNTSRIIDYMKEYGGFIPSSIDQKNTRIPGRELTAKHMIRFRHESVKELKANDHIPEIVLLNSHDGSSAYKIYLGVFKVLCLNDLIVASSTMEAITLRHSRSNLIHDIYTESKKIMDQSNRVNEIIKKWQGIELDKDQKRAYVNGALKLYSDADLKLFYSPDRFLYSHRSAEKDPNVWNVFNVTQERFIRGLFSAQDTNGHYKQMRQIKSIDRKVKLNRDLWEYTENFINN